MVFAWCLKGWTLIPGFGTALGTASSGSAVRIALATSQPAGVQISMVGHFRGAFRTHCIQWHAHDCTDMLIGWCLEGWTLIQGFGPALGTASSGSAVRIALAMSHPAGVQGSVLKHL